jgi:hypothetical protein
MPLDGGLCRLAAPLLVSQASGPTWERHHGGLAFGHLELTALLGGVVENHLPHEATGCGRRTGRRPRRGGMGVQVVQDPTEHGHMGVRAVYQSFLPWATSWGVRRSGLWTCRPPGSDAKHRHTLQVPARRDSSSYRTG